jgi:hypothetical protein
MGVAEGLREAEGLWLLLLLGEKPGDWLGEGEMLALTLREPPQVTTLILWLFVSPTYTVP